jgi:lipopolysaccharide/colanic/teichoic acid biosynthesis glycosyltransferase
MLKFRGMIDNALKYGPELTQQNDPRITKVGRFLRRTSIDELPQLINVIKGEMSIIGPRPEILSITSKYSEEHKEVFKYVPGITGYSQINGRQMLTPQKRTEMEIDYYNNETFWSDIKIVYRTIFVVVSNEGNL